MPTSLPSLLTMATELPEPPASPHLPRSAGQGVGVGVGGRGSRGRGSAGDGRRVHGGGGGGAAPVDLQLDSLALLGGDGECYPAEVGELLARVGAGESEAARVLGLRLDRGDRVDSDAPVGCEKSELVDRLRREGGGRGAGGGREGNYVAR